MADDAITVTQELKPCPFCGGEAQRFTLTEEDEPMNAGGDVITCLKCQASSHVEFGRKENLVSCWNTRTTSLAAQDGLVEARELRRVASIFKQWRSTLMLSKMDGEQWRSLNKAFDDLAALASIEVKS